jgi:hypothetical protein
MKKRAQGKVFDFEFIFSMDEKNLIEENFSALSWKNFSPSKVFFFVSQMSSQIFL